MVSPDEGQSLGLFVHLPKQFEARLAVVALGDGDDRRHRGLGLPSGLSWQVLFVQKYIS